MSTTYEVSFAPLTLGTRAGTQRGGALACRGGTGSGESVAYGLPTRTGVHGGRTEMGSCRKMVARRLDRG
jgi:hypothetical protein